MRRNLTQNNMRQRRGLRENYSWFKNIPTRWMDNDVYGHVNNVAYYSYFDTAVNSYLIESKVLDIQMGSQIGLVVETSCRFFESIAFPDPIEAGLRVAKIGTSSVRYELGLFKHGGELAVAEGHFVHVYVDRSTGRPQQLSPELKQALQTLLVQA